jgi:hypothetical protein
MNAQARCMKAWGPESAKLVRTGSGELGKDVS